MSSESAPPPMYSQDDPDGIINTLPDESQELQILIIPSANSINFQKGYLGADGEHAAIEGELQIKGAEEISWAKVIMSLRTVEAAYHREVEICSSEIVLYSCPVTSRTTLPSSFLFAIPLMSDTPQSICTPHSSLSHTLTATLQPSDPLLPSHSKAITVHTRRYTSHSHSLVISPETRSLDDPTRIEVELPRTTFEPGEIIPIYVTIPPPNRELVVDQGLRLRNVRVELVRVIKVKKMEDEEDLSDTELDLSSGAEGGFEGSEEPFFRSYVTSITGTSRPADMPLSTRKAHKSPLFLDSSYRTTIARSGASCRFHSTRPVQLRFILHQSSPSESPNFQDSQPSGDFGHLESDAECPSISQSTLLHLVTFRLHVIVSFVDMSSHTERFSTVTIPISIIAPPAPLPEVEGSVDAAYQKKHDQPPARTVRHDENLSTLGYFAGRVGSSAHPSGAPPPFEERDAPPPFFSSAMEASTSTRLPTFLESEIGIIVLDDESISRPPYRTPVIVGEGYEFGFCSAEQFDGHSEDIMRGTTPPPTLLEMATMDENITELSDIREPEHAMEALGLTLQQHEEIDRTRRESPPPPPPAMDDPSDPPPLIDSDFRFPVPPRHSPTPIISSSSALHPYPSESLGLIQSTPQSTVQNQPVHGHAPPPYLIPDLERERETVTRPPPYMDIM